MGKAILSLLVISFVLTGHFCHAQTSVRVSDPMLELRDNSIHITYDILNSKSSDRFIVSVDITDVNGNKINANALDGDIGEEVRGGRNKHITWNLEADKIIMNAEILVNVNAELLVPPELLVENSEKEIKKNQAAENDVPTGIKDMDFNRTAIIIQSLALPGLGLSRMTGNPHWIKGVAGYGCVAGSVALNRAAVTTYEDFKSARTIESANSLLAESTTQDNISEVLFYTAIGIWVSDFIWTLVSTSDLNRTSYNSNITGILLSAGLEPISNTPMVAITYRF